MIRRLFRKSPAPKSRLHIQPLLAFQDVLTAGKLKRAVGYARKHGKDKPEVDQLRRLLLDSGLIFGTEWVENALVFERLLYQPERINALTADELRILLTTVSRTDRLTGGGIMAWLCQSGIMTQMLQRLQALHEADAIDSAFPAGASKALH